MIDDKKYTLLISYPNFEPQNYFFYSNDKFWVRYLPLTRWERGCFETDEISDVEGLLDCFSADSEPDFVLSIKNRGTLQTIDKTAKYHRFVFNEDFERVWVQKKGTHIAQAYNDDDEVFWVNDLFHIEDCKDKEVKDLLKKIEEKINNNEGGNEENFHNMLDEITNSEWNSYIECTDEKLEDYICVQNTNVTTCLFKGEVNENLWQDEEKQIEDIKGSISFEEEIKKLDEEEITKKK